LPSRACPQAGTGPGGLPPDLKAFWLEIGCGFIRGRPGGEVVATFSNFFTSPADIADELARPRSLRKMSAKGPAALPFFSLGTAAGLRYAYILEGETRSSIVTYDGYRDVVSASLGAFVEDLLKDPNFHVNAWSHRFPQS
jgi:hypothetical protein